MNKKNTNVYIEKLEEIRTASEGMQGFFAGITAAGALGVGVALVAAAT